MWTVKTSSNFRSHLHFRFLTGDVNWQEYGGKFISRKLNNGEFDYWIVIEVCSDPRSDNYSLRDYIVMCSVVAPSQVSEKDRQSVLRSFGWGNPDDCQAMTDHLWVEVIHSYCGGALLWQGKGHNLRNLMKEARRHACVMGDGMFGFAMDEPQNAIGATGWDLLQGNSYGPLAKYIQA